MHMDTQPFVPLLLRAYDTQLHSLRYPSHSLLTAFRRFLSHPKVSAGSHSQLWHDLYKSFAQERQFGMLLR